MRRKRSGGGRALAPTPIELREPLLTAVVDPDRSSRACARPHLFKQEARRLVLLFALTPLFDFIGRRAEQSRLLRGQFKLSLCFLWGFFFSFPKAASPLGEEAGPGPQRWDDPGPPAGRPAVTLAACFYKA